MFELPGIGLIAAFKLVLRRSCRPVSCRSFRAMFLMSLLERKPARVATVAIANKAARIAWALLTKQETYKAAPAS